MVITAATAVTLLPYLMSMIGKIITALTTKDPVSIEEEIKVLDELRLRPSSEVIAEADKSTGG
jgi:hypothetical protein